MNENNAMVRQATNRMAAVGILGNIFLAAFKLCAGIFGHSAAMLSDSIHTLSDIFATIVAYIGVSISKKEADDNHPFGHDRLECVASLILAVILFMTGAGIGMECLRSIISGSYKEGSMVPGLLAVAAAIVSIAVKEAMFWYTMHYATKLKSSAFKADAWHHRSDALSSIGALVGIIGARHGFAILDPIAGVGICIAVLAVAIGIFRDAIEKMLDTACDEEFESGLREFIFVCLIYRERHIPGVRLVEFPIIISGECLESINTGTQFIHPHIILGTSQTVL